MDEGELEVYINLHNCNSARFILGKLLVEGSNDKIKKNVIKGVNWLKEAIKNGNVDALEFKAYYDIRYDK